MIHCRMAVNTLNDKLSLLAALPTTMKWLSDWDATTQYYKNDVVISPPYFASYILDAASEIGAANPSVNPHWIPVGRSSGGVQNIIAGVGIDLSGSSTKPEIINNGVRNVQYGANIQNIGTAQDIVLDSDAVATITGVMGISVTNLSTITNSGVTSIAGGSGLQPSQPTGGITLSNAGVLSLASTDSLLTVVGGLDKTVLNNGLLSIVDGVAITNVGTSNEYVLQNDGVRTIQYPSNTLRNTGDEYAQKLSAANCQICEVWASVVGMTPNPTTAGANDAVVNIVQTPNTLWANCFATGVPYSSGNFELDLTGLVFCLRNVGGFDVRVNCRLVDGVTQSEWNVGILKNVYPLGPTGTSNLKSVLTLGKVLVDLQKARAAGIRQLTGIRILVSANTPTPIITTALIGTSKGLAVFSPLGVV
jgi:hypothetical protein